MTFVRSVYDSPEAEREDRHDTLDRVETARTFGGRRVAFVADAAPWAVVLLLDDGPAGPGGSFAMYDNAALVLYEQLGRLLGK